MSIFDAFAAVLNETDCPSCSTVLHVHDLCECDHELGPYCGQCCRAHHDPEES